MAAAAATAGLPAVVPASSGTGIAPPAADWLFSGLRVQHIGYDTGDGQSATIYFAGQAGPQGSISTSDPSLIADMAKYMRERTLLDLKYTLIEEDPAPALEGEYIIEEEDRGEEFRDECKLESSVLGSANGCSLMRHGNHLNGSHCAYRASGCAVTRGHALAA